MTVGYADLTKDFSQGWATNTEARTAVAARAAEMNG
jgi:hypothetical protein